jgi:sRNA-binding protein
MDRIKKKYEGEPAYILEQHVKFAVTYFEQQTRRVPVFKNTTKRAARKITDDASVKQPSKASKKQKTTKQQPVLGFANAPKPKKRGGGGGRSRRRKSW